MSPGAGRALAFCAPGRRPGSYADLATGLTTSRGALQLGHRHDDDVLAFYAFPAEHWPKLRSTNPLERFNREIGRRTDVVGIFPDDPSLIRLVSMLAIEANDEWLVGRSYISKGSMALLYDERSDRSPSLRSEQEVAELAAA